MEKYYRIAPSDELYHHGIKGQKWGIRRFENPDGTLTEEGKKRYGTRQSRIKANNKAIEKYSEGIARDTKSLKNFDRYGVKSKDFLKRLVEDDEYYDPVTGEVVPGKKAYLLDNRGDTQFETKEEALATLKKDLTWDIDYGKNAIENLRRENRILMDAPLSSRTFLENKSRGRKIGIAAGLVTGAGLTVGLGVLGGPIAGLLSVPFSLLVGISAGEDTKRAVEKVGVKKEYRRT